MPKLIHFSFQENEIANVGEHLLDLDNMKDLGTAYSEKNEFINKPPGDSAEIENFKQELKGKCPPTDKMIEREMSKFTLTESWTTKPTTMKSMTQLRR